MKLKWYYRKEPTPSFSERPSLIPKSSWKLFLSQLEKELFEVCKSNSGYSNFSKEERECMSLLANDRSIVIRKADKGSCVVVWDLEDYIAEACQQLNDGSVYKSVKFKDKVLQDLAEKSNGILKVLSRKLKLLKSNLSILQLNIKKLPIWGNCICFPRSMKGFMMFLGDQLYRFVEHQ